MFRQYSSTTGRWMSPDPYGGSMDLGNPQSLNRYSYVGNSPLVMTDPSSLDGGVAACLPVSVRAAPKILASNQYLEKHGALHRI